MISGYVLKLARESAAMTQEELACALNMDAHTVHSWETGRRALTATNTRAFIRLQHKLAALGISPLFLDAMRTALEADYVFDYMLGTDDDSQRLADHPLGTFLMTSSLSEMLAWPLTGIIPSYLSPIASRVGRRGPVASNPSLPPPDRQRFFDRLRVDADRALPLQDKDRHHSVLAHQACFRAAWSTTSSMQQWLDDLWRQETTSRGFGHWSPKWLTVRSLAIARARRGDWEALSDFVVGGHLSDSCEIANLNYLAYWAGELSPLQTSNDFMTSASLFHSWTGAKVLQRLTGKLDVTHPDIILNLHSTAVLVKRSVTIHLLESDPELYNALRAKLEAVYDQGTTLPPASAGELVDILHVLRHISPTVKSLRERR